MKKIFCNSILKKIILIMFIVILLFNYIIPCIVFAATYTVEEEASQLVEAWNSNVENGWMPGGVAVPEMTQATAETIIIGFVEKEMSNGYNIDQNDIYDVVKVTNGVITDPNGERVSRRVIYFQTNLEKNAINQIIFEKWGINIDLSNDSTIKTESIQITLNNNQQQIKQWLIDKGWAESVAESIVSRSENYQAHIDNSGNVRSVTVTEAGKLTARKTLLMNKYEGLTGPEANSVLADPVNYEDVKNNEGDVIIDVVLTETGMSVARVTVQDTETNNDITEVRDGFIDAIGGILLEPVFFLVNFIADAIMGLIDNVMENEDLSLISFVPSLMSSNYDTFPDGEENYTTTISNAVGFNSYPNIRYSPERIFSGKVKLLSIDFISNANAAGPLSSVRNTIASWYKALRLFAIIGLLSVLIYTGIKVMLSANAKDKAKYKEWILNWFLAVAILFSMHYIMSFVITVTDEVNTLLGNAVSDGVKAKITLGSGETVRFKTNLIGICRYMVQAESFVTKIGYEVMYIALIVYTFKFTVVYLKRVLNMAFLTLIAPLVALMYPIDKMTDGSAQGFDMWLKEYIFNALLQPMHMLMYYVLVSSAVQVAGSNPIYGIVVLAFMTEAEKLLKKIFGFDKAHGGTVGGMGSAFAAGAVASQIGNLAKQLRGKNSKSGNGGNGEKELPETPKTINDGDNIEDSFAKDDAEKPADDTPSPNTPPQDNNNQFPKEEGKGGFGLNEPLQDEQQNNRDGESGYQDGKDRNNAGEGSKNSKSDSNNNSNKNINRANRFAKGAKSVGKRLAKPIWDFDKSGKYNRRRLTRKIAKGTAGFAVGATAAAVQAGISITDGKYNAFEGIASFGAGFAGGSSMAGGIWDGAKSIKGAFDKGFHSADTPDQKRDWEEKQRERYHQDWSDRDDVNKIFKDKFGEDNFKKMKEQAKVYTDRGFNDPKEVAKLMKISKESGWDNKDTIDKMRFIKQLKDQQAYGSLSDKEKQTKYIDAIIQNNNLSGDNATQVRKRYEEKFKAAAQLDKKLRK